MNREALYVEGTRGRLENRLYVVTGPERSDRQAAPETVLTQALSTPAAEQSATAELAAAMDDSDHPARLLHLYDEITAPERGTQLDEEFRARLEPADFNRYLHDPVSPVLHRAVRHTQLGGHDTAAVLDQITRGSMDRARSVASVLHGRLQDLRLPERQPPAPLAERLPEARTEGLARQAALMMDARTQAIGEQLAARPEPWLADRLGLPPQQPGALRDDWISRAGRAGFYRQAHSVTDPNVALGEKPANNPELLMLWEQAADVLEIRGQDYDVRRAARAALEGTVRAYTRAAGTAPPDMGRRLDYHRQLGAELERQAEEAEAGGNTRLASDSHSAAAEEARQAAELSTAQDSRDAWDRDHEAQRLAARAAHQELDRRGIAAEPEQQESESMTAWVRQFDKDIQAVSQALARQQSEAETAGQPWPPQPDKAPETEASRAEALAVLRRLQRNGYLPGLKLEEYEQQAQTSEPAQPELENDADKRIDSAIGQIHEAADQAAAAREALEQERSTYAVRVAREAQIQAEADHGWPTRQAEGNSAEADYELEL